MDNCEVEKCFDKLIGVYGCHNEGDCKYFINNIPGISNELLSSITDSERRSYTDVFTKSLTASIQSLKIDLEHVMYDHKDRHEFGNTLYTSEEARLIRPREFTLITEKYVGVILTTAPGKYVLADLATISLYPKEDTLATPVLFDFETGKEINRADEIELTGGEMNTIDFNYKVDCSKHRAVFFGFELQNYAEFAQLSCNRFQEEDCSTCTPCESICGDGNELDFKKALEAVFKDEHSEYSIYSASFEDFEDVNTFKEHAELACADLSLVCSMEQFVCQNAKSLASSLQYLVAHNVLTEKLNSPRQNMWAKSNLEFTLIRRDELAKEYKSSLKKIAPKLSVSGDSLCWECVQSGVYTNSLV